MTKNSHLENPIPTAITLSNQTTNEAETPKPPQIQDKRSRLSLRNQLLLSVLPVVLTPLIIGGIIASKFLQQNSEAQIQPKLREQALLAGKAAKSLLEEELKLPTIVANNPLVIDGARRGSQQAEARGLQYLPNEQVEKSFSATRLLQPNQDLNDYLRRTAKIGKVAQLSLTEKYGFNIGYTNPPYDFVQSDEQWWQEGKNKQQWVSAPDFDPSVRIFSISLVQSISDPQSGEFLGMVKSIVPASRFDRVTKYLESTKIEDSEIIQLIDSSTGGVITTTTAKGASSTRRVKGSEAILSVSAALVRASQEPNLNLEQVMGELEKQYSLQELTFNRFNPDTNENEPSASFYSQDKYYTIATIPRMSWVAIASIDRGDMGAMSSRLTMVLALTALVLVIGVVVILLWLARRLSFPLVNIANKFAQASSGNLALVERSNINREIQALIRSSNDLIIKIKSLIEQQDNYDVLHRELKQLIKDIEKLSHGDLTVKAKLGNASVSAVAESFNLNLESLRNIVLNVKYAAAKINSAIAQNEAEAGQLSNQIRQQSAHITDFLKQYEEMNLSIQGLVEKAKVTSQIAHKAVVKAETGGENIDQTVDIFYQLRSLTATTAKKVKQLGEFSQEIVLAMGPINQIAMQTKVLAINANIEAAKREGKYPGLAAVAEEVEVLSESLAIAKTEIEQIIEKIQQKTSDVVENMELEISEIVTGANSVEKAQQDVGQIFEVSRQLEQLVKSLADDTMNQAQTSRSLTRLKPEIIKVNEHISDSSLAVTSAWQEILLLARQLQLSIETFKIGDET